MISTSHIHQTSASLTFHAAPVAVSHCQLLFGMSASRFFGELGATALTDEVGESDGQLRRFLRPQARLALTSCAMFSEGARHSAVAQVDRQMVHVATEHERDWESSGGIPRWSALAIEEPAFFRRRRLATRLHTGDRAWTSRCRRSPGALQRCRPSNTSQCMKESRVAGGWLGGVRPRLHQCS